MSPTVIGRHAGQHPFLNAATSSALVRLPFNFICSHCELHSKRKTRRHTFVPYVIACVYESVITMLEWPNRRSLQSVHTDARRSTAKIMGGPTRKCSVLCYIANLVWLYRCACRNVWVPGLSTPGFPPAPVQQSSSEGGVLTRDLCKSILNWVAAALPLLIGRRLGEAKTGYGRWLLRVLQWFATDGDRDRENEYWIWSLRTRANSLDTLFIDSGVLVSFPPQSAAEVIMSRRQCREHSIVCWIALA